MKLERQDEQRPGHQRSAASVSRSSRRAAPRDGGASVPPHLVHQLRPRRRAGCPPPATSIGSRLKLPNCAISGVGRRRVDGELVLFCAKTRCSLRLTVRYSISSLAPPPWSAPCTTPMPGQVHVRAAAVLVGPDRRHREVRVLLELAARGSRSSSARRRNRRPRSPRARRRPSPGSSGRWPSSAAASARWRRGRPSRSGRRRTRRCTRSCPSAGRAGPSSAGRRGPRRS